MLCLFESGLLVKSADFRITFADSLTGHGKIHADFGALAGEVHTEAFDDLRIDAFCNADAVLVSPGHRAGLLFKLRSRRAALGAFFGSCFAFVNITTDFANKLFHIQILQKLIFSLFFRTMALL